MLKNLCKIQEDKELFAIIVGLILSAIVIYISVILLTTFVAALMGTVAIVIIWALIYCILLIDMK